MLSKEEIEELNNSDPFTKRRLEKLKSGEFSWTEYIVSLTPEDLELERESKRHWAKVWYQTKQRQEARISKGILYEEQRQETRIRKGILHEKQR